MFFNILRNNKVGYMVSYVRPNGKGNSRVFGSLRKAYKFAIQMEKAVHEHVSIQHAKKGDVYYNRGIPTGEALKIMLDEECPVKD